MQFGYVIGGWYHLRSYLAAANRGGDASFNNAKQLAAKFYMQQMLPRAQAHADAIIGGSDIGCELSSAAFMS